MKVCPFCSSEESICYYTGIAVVPDEDPDLGYYVGDAYICAECNEIFISGFGLQYDMPHLILTRGTPIARDFVLVPDLSFTKVGHDFYLKHGSPLRWKRSLQDYNARWYPSFESSQEFI